MRVVRSFIFSVVVILFPGLAIADVSGVQKTEVAHLLQFIRSTDCTIERNGSRYKGGEAYSHVMKKYKHFRGRIKTTEDFIEYAATKSMLSGKVYFVICGTQRPLRTRDWLLKELSNYRQ